MPSVTEVTNPLKCPVCKADNATPPTCRRCKADLAMLWAVEDHRRTLVERAKAAMADRQYDDALESLNAAERARPGADLAPLRASATLLAGDFAGAYRVYREIRAS
jgi:methylphosphotriester-DNA--protein-cysteine methyltransferase